MKMKEAIAANNAHAKLLQKNRTEVISRQEFISEHVPKKIKPYIEDLLKSAVSRSRLGSIAIEVTGPLGTDIKQPHLTVAEVSEFHKALDPTTFFSELLGDDYIYVFTYKVDVGFGKISFHLDALDKIEVDSIIRYERTR